MKSMCVVCETTERETVLVKGIDEQELDYHQACKSCIRLFNLRIIKDTEAEARLLTEKFISNLKVGNEYSTGFQVNMKIEDVEYNLRTEEMMNIICSDNDTDGTYCISREQIYMNMKSQLDKEICIYIPILIRAGEQ